MWHCHVMEETIVTLGGVVMDGSNIPHFRYCGPSHYIAKHFYSLTSHIQKIWTKTSQTQQKLCNLCILFVLNNDISHGVVISTIFSDRIEFSSDGKGMIDSFDYLYVLRAQKHILNHLRPDVFGQGGRGGGGHIMLPVTRPETIIIRHHPSGNNNCYQ